jgi:hypothetical protein
MGRKSYNSIGVTLHAQIERILEINALQEVTKTVVEAPARDDHRAGITDSDSGVRATSYDSAVFQQLWCKCAGGSAGCRFSDRHASNGFEWNESTIRLLRVY